MNFPFPVSIYTKRPLTDLQSLRRDRILERSKAYRDYLRRLRQRAKHRGDQHLLHPRSGGLLFRSAQAYRLQTKPSKFLDNLYKLDLPRGTPHAQMMLMAERLVR